MAIDAQLLTVLDKEMEFTIRMVSLRSREWRKASLELIEMKNLKLFRSFKGSSPLKSGKIEQLEAND